MKKCRTKGVFAGVLALLLFIQGVSMTRVSAASMYARGSASGRTITLSLGQSDASSVKGYQVAISVNKNVASPAYADNTGASISGMNGSGTSYKIVAANCKTAGSVLCTVTFTAPEDGQYTFSFSEALINETSYSISSVTVNVAENTTTKTTTTTRTTTTKKTDKPDPVTEESDQVTTKSVTSAVSGTPVATTTAVTPLKLIEGSTLLPLVEGDKLPPAPTDFKFEKETVLGNVVDVAVNPTTKMRYYALKKSDGTIGLYLYSSVYSDFTSLVEIKTAKDTFVVLPPDTNVKVEPGYIQSFVTVAGQKVHGFISGLKPLTSMPAANFGQPITEVTTSPVPMTTSTELSPIATTAVSVTTLPAKAANILYLQNIKTGAKSMYYYDDDSAQIMACALIQNNVGNIPMMPLAQAVSVTVPEMAATSIFSNQIVVWSIVIGVLLLLTLIALVFLRAKMKKQTEEQNEYFTSNLNDPEPKESADNNHKGEL